EEPAETLAEEAVAGEVLPGEPAKAPAREADSATGSQADARSRPSSSRKRLRLTRDGVWRGEAGAGGPPNTHPPPHPPPPAPPPPGGRGPPATLIDPAQGAPHRRPVQERALD